LSDPSIESFVQNTSPDEVLETAGKFAAFLDAATDDKNPLHGQLVDTGGALPEPIFPSDDLNRFAAKAIAEKLRIQLELAERQAFLPEVNRLVRRLTKEKPDIRWQTDGKSLAAEFKRLISVFKSVNTAQDVTVEVQKDIERARLYLDTLPTITIQKENWRQVVLSINNQLVTIAKPWFLGKPQSVEVGDQLTVTLEKSSGRELRLRFTGTADTQFGAYTLTRPVKSNRTTVSTTIKRMTWAALGLLLGVPGAITGYFAYNMFFNVRLPSQAPSLEPIRYELAVTDTSVPPTSTATTVPTLTADEQLRQQIQQEFMQRGYIGFLTKDYFEQVIVPSRTEWLNVKENQIRIYGRELTASEIQEVVQNPVGHFVLLGTDLASNAWGEYTWAYSRSDIVMDVYFNFQTGDITTVNISRDFLLSDGYEVDPEGNFINTIPFTQSQSIALPGVDEENLRDSPLLNVKLRYEAMTGVPVDGVNIVTLDGFVTIIRRLYPRGMTIYIPFDWFGVGEERHPAGTYTLTPDEVLRFIRNRKGEKDSTAARDRKAQVVLNQIIKDLIKRSLVAGTPKKGFDDLENIVLGLIRNDRMLTNMDLFRGDPVGEGNGLLASLEYRDSLARRFVNPAAYLAALAQLEGDVSPEMIVIAPVLLEGTAIKDGNTYRILQPFLSKYVSPDFSWRCDDQRCKGSGAFTTGEWEPVTPKSMKSVHGYYAFLRDIIGKHFPGKPSLFEPYTQFTGENQTAEDVNAFRDTLARVGDPYHTRSQDATIAIGEQYLTVSQSDGSKLGGPLVGRMLLDAGLVSKDLNPHDLWTVNMDPSERGRTLNEWFPENKFEWFETSVPVNEFDFGSHTLQPGDVVYLKGGDRTHWLLITRVDGQGRVYGVTSVQQGFLASDSSNTDWLIQEVLVYDPQRPEDGLFYKWLDPAFGKLFNPGAKGFILFRSKPWNTEPFSGMEQYPIAPNSITGETSSVESVHQAATRGVTGLPSEAGYIRPGIFLEGAWYLLQDTVKAIRAWMAAPETIVNSPVLRWATPFFARLGLGIVPSGPSRTTGQLSVQTQPTAPVPVSGEVGQPASEAQEERQLASQIVDVFIKVYPDYENQKDALITSLLNHSVIGFLTDRFFDPLHQKALPAITRDMFPKDAQRYVDEALLGTLEAANGLPQPVLSSVALPLALHKAPWHVVGEIDMEKLSSVNNVMKGTPTPKLLGDYALKLMGSRFIGEFGTEHFRLVRTKGDKYAIATDTDIRSEEVDRRVNTALEGLVMLYKEGRRIEKRQLRFHFSPKTQVTIEAEEVATAERKAIEAIYSGEEVYGPDSRRTYTQKHRLLDAMHTDIGTTLGLPYAFSRFLIQLTTGMVIDDVLDFRAARLQTELLVANPDRYIELIPFADREDLIYSNEQEQPTTYHVTRINFARILKNVVTDYGDEAADDVIRTIYERITQYLVAQRLLSETDTTKPIVVENWRRALEFYFVEEPSTAIRPEEFRTALTEVLGGIISSQDEDYFALPLVTTTTVTFEGSNVDGAHERNYTQFNQVLTTLDALEDADLRTQILARFTQDGRPRSDVPVIGWEYLRRLFDPNDTRGASLLTQYDATPADVAALTRLIPDNPLTTDEAVRAAAAWQQRLIDILSGKRPWWQPFVDQGKRAWEAVKKSWGEQRLLYLIPPQLQPFMGGDPAGEERKIKYEGSTAYYEFDTRIPLTPAGSTLSITKFYPGKAVFEYSFEPKDGEKLFINGSVPEYPWMFDGSEILVKSGNGDMVISGYVAYRKEEPQIIDSTELNGQFPLGLPIIERPEQEHIQRVIGHRINAVQKFFTEVLNIPFSQMVNLTHMHYVDADTIAKHLGALVGDAQQQELEEFMGLGEFMLGGYHDSFSGEIYLNAGSVYPVQYSSAHEYVHQNGYNAVEQLPEGGWRIQEGTKEVELDVNRKPVSVRRLMFNEQLTEWIHRLAQRYAGYDIPETYRGYGAYPPVLPLLLSYIDSSGEGLRVAYTQGDLRVIQEEFNAATDLVTYLAEVVPEFRDTRNPFAVLEEFFEQMVENEASEDRFFDLYERIKTFKPLLILRGEPSPQEMISAYDSNPNTPRAIQRQWELMFQSLQKEEIFPDEPATQAQGNIEDEIENFVHRAEGLWALITPTTDDYERQLYEGRIAEISKKIDELILKLHPEFDEQALREYKIDRNIQQRLMGPARGMLQQPDENRQPQSRIVSGGFREFFQSVTDWMGENFGDLTVFQMPGVVRGIFPDVRYEDLAIMNWIADIRRSVDPRIRGIGRLLQRTRAVLPTPSQYGTFHFAQLFGRAQLDQLAFLDVLNDLGLVGMPFDDLRTQRPEFTSPTLESVHADLPTGFRVSGIIASPLEPGSQERHLYLAGVVDGQGNPRYVVYWWEEGGEDYVALRRGNPIIYAWDAGRRLIQQILDAAGFIVVSRFEGEDGPLHELVALENSKREDVTNSLGAYLAPLLTGLGIPKEGAGDIGVIIAQTFGPRMAQAVNVFANMTGKPLLYIFHWPPAVRASLIRLQDSLDRIVNDTSVAAPARNIAIDQELPVPPEIHGRPARTVSRIKNALDYIGNIRLTLQRWMLPFQRVKVVVEEKVYLPSTLAALQESIADIRSRLNLRYGTERAEQARGRAAILITDLRNQSRDSDARRRVQEFRNALERVGFRGFYMVDTQALVQEVTVETLAQLLLMIDMYRPVGRNDVAKIITEFNRRVTAMQLPQIRSRSIKLQRFISLTAGNISWEYNRVTKDIRIPLLALTDVSNDWMDKLFHEYIHSLSSLHILRLAQEGLLLRSEADIFREVVAVWAQREFAKTQGLADPYEAFPEIYRRYADIADALLLVMTTETSGEEAQRLFWELAQGRVTPFVTTLGKGDVKRGLTILRSHLRRYGAIGTEGSIGIFEEIFNSIETPSERREERTDEGRTPLPTPRADQLSQPAIPQQEARTLVNSAVDRSRLEKYFERLRSSVIGGDAIGFVQGERVYQWQSYFGVYGVLEALAGSTDAISSLLDVRTYPVNGTTDEYLEISPGAEGLDITYYFTPQQAEQLRQAGIDVRGNSIRFWSFGKSVDQVFEEANAVVSILHTTQFYDLASAFDHVVSQNEQAYTSMLMTPDVQSGLDHIRQIFSFIDQTLPTLPPVENPSREVQQAQETMKRTFRNLLVNEFSSSRAALASDIVSDFNEVLSSYQALVQRFVTDGVLINEGYKETFDSERLDPARELFSIVATNDPYFAKGPQQGKGGFQIRLNMEQLAGITTFALHDSGDPQNFVEVQHDIDYHHVIFLAAMRYLAPFHNGLFDQYRPPLGDFEYFEGVMPPNIIPFDVIERVVWLVPRTTGEIRGDIQEFGEDKVYVSKTDGSVVAVKGLTDQEIDGIARDIAAKYNLEEEELFWWQRAGESIRDFWQRFWKSSDRGSLKISIPARQSAPKSLTTLSSLQFYLPTSISPSLFQRSLSDILKSDYPDFYSGAKAEEWHVKFVMDRTNIIRGAIEAGAFATADSKTMFHTIATLHLGATPLERLIAYSDRDESDELGVYYPLDIIAETNRWFGQNGDDNGAFLYGSVRKKDIEGRMVRTRPGEDRYLFTVPAETVPDLSNALFQIVDTVLARADQGEQFLDDDIYQFTLFVSTLVDMLHIKPDGNGRSSEDFMVALQWRLFHGDTRKIKTWSLTSLRPRLSQSHVFSLVPNVKEKYDNERAMFNERTIALYQFRVRLYNRLHYALDLGLNNQDDISGSGVAKDEAVLRENTQKVTQAILSLINTLKYVPSQEYRRNRDLYLQNVNSYGIAGLWGALRKYRPDLYQFTTLSYQDTGLAQPLPSMTLQEAEAKAETLRDARASALLPTPGVEQLPTKQEVYIGSGKHVNNLFVIPAERLIGQFAPDHALVRAVGNTLEIQNLAQFGTWINGTPMAVNETRRLLFGDEVIFGQDPKVPDQVWRYSVDMDDEGRVVLPRFSPADPSNTAMIALPISFPAGAMENSSQKAALLRPTDTFRLASIADVPVQSNEKVVIVYTSPNGSTIALELKPTSALSSVIDKLPQRVGSTLRILRGTPKRYVQVGTMVLRPNGWVEVRGIGSNGAVVVEQEVPEPERTAVDRTLDWVRNTRFAPSGQQLYAFDQSFVWFMGQMERVGQVVSRWFRETRAWMKDNPIDKFVAKWIVDITSRSALRRIDKPIDRLVYLGKRYSAIAPFYRTLVANIVLISVAIVSMVTVHPMIVTVLSSWLSQAWAVYTASLLMLLSLGVPYLFLIQRFDPFFSRSSPYFNAQSSIMAFYMVQEPNQKIMTYIKDAVSLSDIEGKLTKYEYDTAQELIAAYEQQHPELMPELRATAQRLSPLQTRWNALTPEDKRQHSLPWASTSDMGTFAYMEWYTALPYHTSFQEDANTTLYLAGLVRHANDLALLEPYARNAEQAYRAVGEKYLSKAVGPVIKYSDPLLGALQDFRIMLLTDAERKFLGMDYEDIGLHDRQNNMIGIDKKVIEVKDHVGTMITQTIVDHEYAHRFALPNANGRLNTFEQGEYYREFVEGGTTLWQYLMYLERGVSDPTIRSILPYHREMDVMFRLRDWLMIKGRSSYNSIGQLLEFQRTGILGGDLAEDTQTMIENIQLARQHYDREFNMLKEVMVRWKDAESRVLSIADERTCIPCVLAQELARLTHDLPSWNVRLLVGDVAIYGNKVVIQVTVGRGRWQYILDFEREDFRIWVKNTYFQYWFFHEYSRDDPPPDTYMTKDIWNDIQTTGLLSREKILTIIPEDKLIPMEEAIRDWITPVFSTLAK
jgi:hypothetical protein